MFLVQCNSCNRFCLFVLNWPCLNAFEMGKEKSTANSGRHFLFGQHGSHGRGRSSALHLNGCCHFAASRSLCGTIGGSGPQTAERRRAAGVPSIIRTLAVAPLPALPPRAPVGRSCAQSGRGSAGKRRLVGATGPRWPRTSGSPAFALLTLRSEEIVPRRFLRSNIGAVCFPFLCDYERRQRFLLDSLSAEVCRLT